MSKLNWKGDAVLSQAETAMANALGTFGLRVEGEAKKELWVGHGVDTGTLQRSIHTAPPSYVWSADNIPRRASTPERGGRFVRAVKISATMTLLVGSGMAYALWVHQGGSGFTGYHYLTNGLARAQPDFPAILLAEFSKDFK